MQPMQVTHDEFYDAKHIYFLSVYFALIIKA